MAVADIQFMEWLAEGRAQRRAMLGRNACPRFGQSFRRYAAMLPLAASIACNGAKRSSAGDASTLQREKDENDDMLTTLKLSDTHYHEI